MNISVYECAYTSVRIRVCVSFIKYFSAFKAGDRASGFNAVLFM